MSGAIYNGEWLGIASLVKILRTRDEDITALNREIRRLEAETEIARMTHTQPECRRNGK